MTRPPRSLAALLVAAPLLLSCGTGTQSTGTSPGAAVASPAAPSSSAPDTWACPIRARTGFTTDPVVHDVGVPLAEIAAQMHPEAFAIERTGRRATVTFRDRHGLIRHECDFSRTPTTGWQLERGRGCSSA